ncbi:MAG TPA: tetratricopeptide repeat protein, partial [Spirochaetia bacterium]|nr:tetratricopeptide repeat protein [Spirochaetia bacterium]
MKRLGLLPVLALTASLLWGASLEEGKSAFGRQDWKTAAAVLGQVVQQNPDDPQAPTAAFLRAVALYQLQDFRGSLDAFQKLERTWPRSEFAHRLPYWKGTAALAAGQWALAERELSGQARYPDEQPFATRALLNLALARVAQGQDGPVVEALEAFTKASTEAPLLAQAWVVWGDLDRKAGRSDRALTRYTEATKSGPPGPWDLAARTNAIDLLVSVGRFDDAKTWLDGATQTYPNETQRWESRRTAVARGLGDTKTLVASLETRWAREADPAAKQALATNRARVSEESGQPEAAWWLKASVGPDATLGSSAILRYAFLVESTGAWAQAAGALEAWSSGRPVAVAEEARDRAAQDRLQAADPASARKLWDRLIADAPRSSRLASWLLARGRVALDAGQSAQALADFSRLLKDLPQSAQAPEARYQTGLVYLQRQEPARAEAWFYPLIQELKSGDLYQRALLARGVCFVNSGQGDLARASLQRLLRETPDGPWAADAWAALGRNALQARLFDEAIDAFSQAKAKQKTPAAQSNALWSLAEAQAGKGDTDAASASYRVYASQFADQPQAAEASYRRGGVYLPGRDWQKALDAWTEALPSARDAGPRIRAGMATALLRLGKPDEGWAQLEALEASSPSPEAWYQWGQAATSAGLGDWATKAFQVLLQKHPDSPAAQAALPRAAGALLTGGKPDEALARYAEYFRRFGQQPDAAPVARAAAAAALPFPTTLEALVTASKTWALVPEVATEFSLAWAQSRLD